MRIRSCFWVLVWAGTACRAAVDSAPDPVTSCMVGEVTVASQDTVSVAISARVAPPISTTPRNGDDRLVHRQLYESIVRIDCYGNLMGGLATEWEVHDGGREWRFMMRPGATFWDGVPVSIVDVIESWERNWEMIETLVPPGDYFNIADAISYDRLIVRLEQPDTMFPRHLARPEFAVARPADGAGGWPIGTGPYRPVLQGGTDLVLTPRQQNTRPTLRLVAIGGADTRDALDAGLDVVLGRENDAVDYVDRRGDYLDIPLTWDQTIALVISTGVVDPEIVLDQRLESLRHEIARDVVGIDARPSVCQSLVGNTDGQGLDAVAGQSLAFDRLDMTTRAVAERLVAVTSDSTRSSVLGLPRFNRVVGVDGENIMARVAAGTASAIVRYDHWTACDIPPQILGLLDNMVLVPLVDARVHLFSVLGTIEAELGWDGTPMFFPQSRP